jgi:hypothetical protein
MTALGPDFTALPFAIGRFALAIQRTLQGTHQQQLLVEDSTSVFVLELGPDRIATACRGWRYHFTNDGPNGEGAERFRDQRGYRGRFTVSGPPSGGVAELELREDPTVCPTVSESRLALTRAAIIRLRCVLARPHAPSLPGPVLLCEWVDPTLTEAAAHLVPALAPPGWMVLGSGNGLAVKLTGRPPGAHRGPDSAVAIVPTPARLEPTTWDRSF